MVGASSALFASNGDLFPHRRNTHSTRFVEEKFDIYSIQSIDNEKKHSLLLALMSSVRPRSRGGSCWRSWRNNRRGSWRNDRRGSCRSCTDCNNGSDKTVIEINKWTCLEIDIQNENTTTKKIKQKQGKYIYK